MKLYTNRAWLTRQYQTERKSAAEIAREQGVTEMTITRYLTQFGLIRNPRSYSRGR
jgi:DNA-binding MurR/RpiR family transcriptional regulator